MTQKKEEITLNDLQARLNVMYAAVKQAEPVDLLPTHFRAKAIKTSQGETIGFTLDWEFDKSDDELKVIAMSAIHNIAVFYDHCLPYAMSCGIEKDEVKNLSKNCLALRIIRDLDVKDKHPATPVNSSGQHPRLQNVSQGPKLKPGGTVSVHFPSLKSEVNDALLVIHGTIINAETNLPVTDLETLFSEALDAWEAFLRKHKVI